MQKLWMLITTLAMIAIISRDVDSVEVSGNRIKVNVEASVPESIDFGSIRLEFDFHIPSRDELNSSPNLTQEDCGTIRTSGSGVYNISLNGYQKVYCEINSTTGIKYLIIQRRIDGSVDFNRNWTEYENGFGNLYREFWIGNKALHAFTSKRKYKLLIELQANDSTKAYAHYNTFSVGSPETKYKLDVGGYSGNAGDSLSHHNGQKFSTFDHDNDANPKNCAVMYKGGWWYKNCHMSNLNGFYYGGYHSSYADGVDWQSFRGYNESMKLVTMKIYY